MTCQSCQRAQSDPTRDDFQNDCMSCEARALAVTGSSIVSEETLVRLFGESRDDGLRLFSEWAGRMRKVKS